MSVLEQIQEHIQQLPTSLQAEVLNFIEYLLLKARHQEGREWAGFSLAAAMRDMEEEETPTYTAADLKDVFA